MTDLRSLTERYVAAFNAKDLDGVAALMAEGFRLTDPEVTGLGPKPKVLDYIGTLFAENGPPFSFTARDIVVEGERSVIHFELVLGETVLHGVDLIVWQGEVMTEMVAYLTAQT